MNRLSVSIIILTIAAGSIAAPIHDHVTKLDFAAVKTYLNQGGDINLVDQATGKTPLAIAIDKALPKSFEAKKYPFDKRTFMFIKKMINCGLTTGVKKITQLMVYDNPKGNVIVDDLTGNEAATSATCNEAGECQADKAGATSQEASCITQEEVTDFISQVRRDAPNCVTAVTDILAGANDFLFEHILFYEAAGQESPELNMIKLLVSNNAKIAAGTKDLIRKTKKAVDETSELGSKQALVRGFGDFVAFVLGNVAHSFVEHRTRGMVRYPINAAFYMIGVKGILDLRNFLAAWAHLNTVRTEANDLHQAVFKPAAK